MSIINARKCTEIARAHFLVRCSIRWAGVKWRRSRPPEVTVAIVADELNRPGISGESISWPGFLRKPARINTNLATSPEGGGKRP